MKMEGVKLGMCRLQVVAVMMMLVPALITAQISTPCTASMVTSFTPCVNFVTGSSGNGVSPTASCCGALKDVVAASMDCACLLLTANVPIQLPFGRTPSVSLPKACKMGVPLRCKASGSPLPAPGPAILNPSSPLGPSAAAAGVADAPAPDSTVTLPLSPAIPPEADNPTGGARPVVNAASASLPSHDVLSAASLLIAMAILLVTYYCF
ncbi:unnamed protein product [Linum trigynum]|uniref:Bifunctional inhibitor/plant lipid transfer protein/seed storage helical domain-containing protein n=1 Tax=Linum trigynum TaxID=586398 RepID=A0AAV2EVJ2_9ROSI